MQIFFVHPLPIGEKTQNIPAHMKRKLNHTLFWALCLCMSMFTYFKFVAIHALMP